MLRVLLAFCVFVQSGTSQFIYNYKVVIPYQIAGMFENTNTQLHAFNESMRHISNGEVNIQPIILQPPRFDSYSMWRELCANTHMRPIAVIGPQNPISDGAVRDQCAIANIPHIQATWQPLDSDTLEEEEEQEGNEDEVDDEEEEDGEEKGGDGEATTEEDNEEEEEPAFQNISINFFPNSDEINLAFAKLLKYYNWENFAVLYEDDFGLMRIQKILALYSDKYHITIRRLDPEATDNHKIFKELYLYQDSRILLDCHVNRIDKYLDEAETMKVVNDYQHYIFTSMDVSTIAATSIQNRPCNSTWLSFTEYNRPDLVSRVSKWVGPDPSKKDNRVSVRNFEIEALIMDDIANHVMQSLKNITKKPQYPLCGKGVSPWKYGAKLQKQILNIRRMNGNTIIVHSPNLEKIHKEFLFNFEDKITTEGVTGHIEFDKSGRRRNYVLYVNEKNLNEIKVIGRWESANSSAIIETRSTSEILAKQSTSKQFRIISRKLKPYFFDKTKCEGDDCEEDDPSEKYEGFVVDLVKEIFKYFKKEKYNYTYVFVNETEKGYGKLDEKTKKYTGIIGDLLDKKVDLAICDFTITEERKKVIDFSVPFMSLGISILYVKEHKIKPGMFSFLNPYTFDVWLYAGTAYCGVSVVLFICARISPADWENPEPCDKDPEELENIWTFQNCAWLTMGSIMTQGCDILPKAIGTRWVCAMWWFFAVIFCQTYIAQLSASMTSALDNEPINNVEDLAKQTKILYGAFDGGSTMEFFKSSKDKMYRQMYDTMMANRAVLVDSNDEGERRVLRGKSKYAFFMESSTIDYKLKRECELKKVGGELDSKDYGIAMPANSPFRSQINRAILSLKESTILGQIKDKWWNEKYGAKACDTKKKEDDVEGDLEMENLIGLFYVLIGGLFLCVFVTAAEFFNEIRNIVVREQLTHKEAFIQELKASLNFFQLRKPILKNPSRAPSIESSDKSEKREKRSNAIENFLDFEKQVQ